MKLSHVLWGHPKSAGHGGEVWQNVVHWRREWATTSVFLPWEPHEQYEKYGKGRVRRGKIMNLHSQSPQIKKKSRCKVWKITSVVSSLLFPEKRPENGGALINTNMYYSMTDSRWKFLNSTLLKDCSSLAVYPVVWGQQLPHEVCESQLL